MKKILVAFSLLSTIVSSAQHYALNLNGTSQAVSIGSPISTGSSYTKEAWVYLVSGSSNNNIISSSSAPFWITSGILYAGHGGSYTFVADPTTFPTDRWVHVAVTYDAPSATMRLYRDGVLVATRGSAPAYTSEPSFIGSHEGTLSFFRGRIDEVRIWNTARTQAQIKSTMFLVPPTTPGLVAHYSCNEGSGTTVADTKANFNGTTIGSTPFIASPIVSSAAALSLDGANDYVLIPDHNSLDITSAITLEAWVYPTKNTGTQNVMAKSSQPVNLGYIFPRTDDGWNNFCVYFVIGSNWVVLNSPYPALNTWHHLAATYDGSMIRMYLDGALVRSFAITGTIPVTTNALAIGNQPGFNEYYGGYVDELRIWNVARTQAQIQSTMNSQLNPTLETGLVSYYRFNQGIVAGNNVGLYTIYDVAGSNNGLVANLAMNGATSNYVAQNSLVALPVNWESFSAIRRADKALLQWTTAGEQNTKEFLVQRSRNAIEWEELGSLPAAGFSNTAQQYRFEDAQPGAGANYYRILQVDMDGKEAYSEVKLLQFSKATGKIFSIVSNPAPKNALSLLMTTNAQVAVFDNSGKLIWQQHTAPGLLTIDLSSQPAGTYIVKANDQAEQVVVK